MTTPDTDDKVRSPFAAGGTEDDGLAASHPPPNTPPIPPKTKDHGIHVSPAVLDAAGKNGDDLLRSLRTTPEGLTQTEAEERLRTTGPNEVAQERRQGWPIRLLKIIRNPLVILLAVSLVRSPLPPATRAPELSWRSWWCLASRCALYRKPARTRRRPSSKP